MQEELLWTRLRAVRFEVPHAGPCTFRGYRARALAATALRPIPPYSLVEVEDCGLAADEERLDNASAAASEAQAAGRAPRVTLKAKFPCPLFGQMLAPTGETTEEGQRILHCSVCDKHVYTCGTRGEVAKYAGKQCVRFPKHIFSRLAEHGDDADGGGSGDGVAFDNFIEMAVLDDQPGAPVARALIRGLLCHETPLVSVQAQSPATAPYADVRVWSELLQGEPFRVWALHAAPGGLFLPDGTAFGASPAHPAKLSGAATISDECVVPAAPASPLSVVAAGGAVRQLHVASDLLVEPDEPLADRLLPDLVVLLDDWGAPTWQGEMSEPDDA